MPKKVKSEADDGGESKKKKKEKSETSDPEEGGKKKKKKEKSEVSEADEGGKKKKKKEKSEGDDGGSKKKKKKDKSDKSDGGSKKKKKKNSSDLSDDGGSKKKKKASKNSDSESLMKEPPVRELDRLRKSQFIRQEKLCKLRQENAPPEELYKEMFEEDYDDKIDDLENEIKKLKKTIEKQKDPKKSKLPPEAHLQMQNDWIVIQIREWKFKIDNMESKFELVKKAHQNAVNSLQEAHVIMVNHNEMEEMREALRNKKNDLFEASQLIQELQKVAWSMLPPKVGKHCQEVEEKMISFRKKLEDISFEMYRLKMEKVSHQKEITALTTAVEGEAELEQIMIKKIDHHQTDLDAEQMKKAELENAITNGLNLLETAGITYEDAMAKAAEMPAEAAPIVEEVHEEKKKEKKEKKKKKKKKKEKKKAATDDDTDEEEEEGGAEGKKNANAQWDEKSKFLEDKKKEIDCELAVVRKEMEKSSKDHQALLVEVKKQADAKAAIAKFTKEKEQLGLTLQQEVVLRKTYYNQIEDLKGKIRVFSRCRPISKSELDRGNTQCVSFPDKYTVAVHGVTKDNKPKEFQFDLVFPPETDQPDVFVDTSRLIQSAFDGFNVCIFGYGQTGSGKTHTLIGNMQKAPGIAPRSFTRLYEIVNDGKAKFTAVLRCYMLELYNEKLLDLMANNAEYSDKLEIKKDQHGMVIVPGAELLLARDGDELRDLFLKGNGNRHIASTKMNAESSRSHLILSIMIECTQLANGKIIRGKMSIIDLAGSERMAKSGVKGVGATEATAINMSLSALGDVISALTSGQPFIPYRNNKLTLLMQDSLGGNAKTLMFVNLSPVDYNATETVSSLTYAQRVKLIKNDAMKVADTEEMPKLQKIVDRLQSGEHIEDFAAAMQVQ